MNLSAAIISFVVYLLVTLQSSGSEQATVAQTILAESPNGVLPEGGEGGDSNRTKTDLALTLPQGEAMRFSD